MNDAVSLREDPNATPTPEIVLTKDSPESKTVLLANIGSVVEREKPQELIEKILSSQELVNVVKCSVGGKGVLVVVCNSWHSAYEISVENDGAEYGPNKIKTILMLDKPPEEEEVQTVH